MIQRIVSERTCAGRDMMLVVLVVCQPRVQAKLAAANSLFQSKYRTIEVTSSCRSMMLLLFVLVASSEQVCWVDPVGKLRAHA